MFKIKDGYKLELQTPETVKLFSSTKELIDKTKNREHVPSLEEIEVVFLQCNLVIINMNKGLNYFTTNKSCACFLNVESSNLVLLKT